MKRRKFLELTSFGSAALATSFYLPSVQDKRKLKIGLLGAGWYGMVDINAALKTGGVEVIAICDVDSDHLKNSADEIEKLQGSRPKTFKYYQDLLGVKGLEAVFIGTMPHWHALQFIAACEKKLAIYCEKPLSYDIKEGMAMVNMAEKTGNIVQVGFQRRNSGAFKKTKQLIESGKIGDVHQIVAQIHYDPGPQDTKIQAPPPALDWEEWCGPAPKLEYRPNIGHKAWRLEKEYGNGHLVDWGIHLIDAIRMIMSEGMPEEFRTSGGIYKFKNQITTPDTLTAAMAFPKAPVVWQHRLWGTGDINSEFNNGIFFYGEKGSLFATESKVTIYPADRKAQKEEISIPATTIQEDHVGNFIKAVRDQDRSFINCTPADAFKSTATVQLAMISYNTGSVVKWDQKNMEVVGNPAATSLLKRDYRGKYKHP